MPLTSLRFARPDTLAWATLALAVAVSCADEPPCAAVAIRAALVGGSPTEGYLGLAPAQAKAIVEVTGTVDGLARRCTGVLVDQTHVLSAAHCDLVFRAADGVVHVDGTQVAARVVRHPTLDLLVGTLAFAPGPGIAPIGVVAADLGPALVGTIAVIAGYGDDQRGGAGSLAFAASPVVEVGPADVLVSGGGRSGGCSGDSGGPLLVRGSAGDVRVAGTLTTSSLTCRDRSRFVRLDLARAWLLAEGVGAVTGPCGTLGLRGGCFEERAIWCDGASVRLEPCTAGVCAWSDAAGGFRCVDPAADACGGIDARGRCEGQRVVRCRQGRLWEGDCTACGLTCRRAPATYVAGCW